MWLKKSQRNEIFDLITSTGLSPRDFEIIKTDSLFEQTKINFKNSKYYFTLTHDGHSDVIKQSPGDEKLIEEYTTRPDWNHKKVKISDWLKRLKSELEQPDKWNNYYLISDEFNWRFNDDKDNSKFSFAEIEEISNSINQVKNQVRELELTDEKLNIINDKLDYLLEKSKVLGKLDWKNLFVGTIITLIVQLSLPVDLSQQIWKIIGEAFKSFILIALK